MILFTLFFFCFVLLNSGEEYSTLMSFNQLLSKFQHLKYKKKTLQKLIEDSVERFKLHLSV